MSSVKKLKINPAFFKLGGSKSKKQKKSRSVSSSALNKTIQPNEIKKKLLQRIKDHQKQNNENKEKALEKSNVKTFHDEFKESLNYLNGVVETRSKKKKKRTMRNNKHLLSKENVLTHNKLSQQLPPQPYGCLKGGKKPTYRQYHQTLKKKSSHSTNGPKLTIEDKPKPMIETKTNHLDRKNKLNDVKLKLSTVFSNPLIGLDIPEPPPTKRIKQRNKTIKRKIKLGKYKNIVGVLVNNKKTRKRIKNDINVLKTTKLTDVKGYLKRHNLMKIGSAAPEDILRRIYEDARLAGSIYNKNPEVLLHNYMSE